MKRNEEEKAFSKALRKLDALYRKERFPDVSRLALQLRDLLSHARGFEDAMNDLPFSKELLASLTNPHPDFLNSLLWYAAAAQLRQREYHVGLNHLMEAQKSFGTEESASSVLGLMNEVALRTVRLELDRMICQFHESRTQKDNTTVLGLPKKLKALLTSLEAQEPSLEQLELQFLVLYNRAWILMSSGNSKGAFEALETALKKSMMFLGCCFPSSIGKSAGGNNESTRSQKGEESGKKRKVESTEKENTTEGLHALIQQILELLSIVPIPPNTGKAVQNTGKKKRKDIGKVLEGWKNEVNGPSSVSGIISLTLSCIHLFVFSQFIQQRDWSDNLDVLERCIKLQRDEDAQTKVRGKGGNPLEGGISSYDYMLLHREGGKGQTVIHVTCYLLSMHHFADGQIERAMQEVDACLLCCPSFSPAQYLKGCILYQSNQIGHAIECFKQCIQFECQSIQCLNLLGLCCANSGKPFSAVQYLEQALRLSSEDSMDAIGLLYNISVLYKQMNKPEEERQMLAYLQQAYEEATKDAGGSHETNKRPSKKEEGTAIIDHRDSYATLACESLLAQLAFRHSDQRLLVSLDSVTSETIVYAMADCCMRHKDYAEAVRHYQSLFDSLCKDTLPTGSRTGLPVDAILMLRDFTQCLLATHRYGEAKDVCEYIMQAEPFDPVTLFHLACTLRALEMPSEGMECIDTLIDLLRAFEMDDEQKGKEKSALENKKRKQTDSVETVRFNGKAIRKSVHNEGLFDSSYRNAYMAKAYNAKGVLFTHLNEHDKGLKMLQLACTLDQDLIEGAFNHVLLLLKFGKKAEAHSCWMSFRKMPLNESTTYYETFLQQLPEIALNESELVFRTDKPSEEELSALDKTVVSQFLQERIQQSEVHDLLDSIDFTDWP